MDLRGASAEALADLTGRLEDAAGSAKSTAALGDELFEVSRLFRAEPGLRRFATDAALAPEERQGMVQQVFKGRLGDTALHLLTEAAGRRWTLSRDLPDALERLSEIAAVRSAGKDSDTLTDELFAVHQLLGDNPDLRDALSDPARSTEDKSELLGSLLDGHALPATVTLAQQALAGTYHTVTAALATYRQVAADVAGEAVATVRVARPLSAKDSKRLAEVLTAQYGKTVHLNIVVDPDVLGGIRVEIGDEVIDGTVAHRLDEARRRLAG